MQESGLDLGSGAARRLVIMRHAKAEATAPSDHERALAPRGRADAEAAGRWLRDAGDRPRPGPRLRRRTHPPDLGAGRRRLPAGTTAAVDFSEGLYAAGSDSAFDLLRETDPAVTSLVVIGHNPTMAYVAELIDDGEGDADATTGLVTRGFPTSALAVFTVEGPWADLGPGGGRLEAFHAGEA